MFTYTVRQLALLAAEERWLATSQARSHEQQQSPSFEIHLYMQLGFLLSDFAMPDTTHTQSVGETLARLEHLAKGLSNANKT